MYINGHLRESTGNYTGVSLLIIGNAVIGLGLTLYLTSLGDETIEKPENPSHQEEGISLLST